MHAYSIRVVASETGIPAETLRVWERRYGFPKPERRPGGARLYAEKDVARLRLIARARDAGYRPGDVIALSDPEILRLVERDVVRAQPARANETASTLVDALSRDDVDHVRRTLRSLALALGPRTFVTDVAHPFAIAMGNAWAAGQIEVRHEHLGAALLTTQLHVSLATFDDGVGAPIVVLATLPGEAHTLGLDMVALYLATHRATMRIVGGETPADQIAAAARSLKADVVGISVSRASDPAPMRRHVERLRRALDATQVELWLGGAGATDVAEASDRVRFTPRWADVDHALLASRRA
jgi:DNA-binding transcriptional MerR regulator/methylmalonyl-CoA mutase cobalamin-binding subunit